MKFVDWLENFLIHLVYGDSLDLPAEHITIEPMKDQDGGVEDPGVDQNALTPQEKAAAIDTLLPWVNGTWSENNRHNVRVICDWKNLAFEEKEELTATVCAESEFDIHAMNYNYDFHEDGTKYIASTDSGICQWNDHYHGTEISPRDAEYDPQKAVALMCDYWIRARHNPKLKDQWIAHKNGSYKQWLHKV